MLPFDDSVDNPADPNGVAIAKDDEFVFKKAINNSRNPLEIVENTVEITDSREDIVETKEAIDVSTDNLNFATPNIFLDRTILVILDVYLIKFLLLDALDGHLAV